MPPRAAPPRRWGGGAPPASPPTSAACCSRSFRGSPKRTTAEQSSACRHGATRGFRGGDHGGAQEGDVQLDRVLEAVGHRRVVVARQLDNLAAWRAAPGANRRRGQRRAVVLIRQDE